MADAMPRVSLGTAATATPAIASIISEALMSPEAQRDPYPAATFVRDRGQPTPTAGTPASPAAARSPAARVPSANGLAPRRSTDPAPRVALVSACLRTPAPGRCRYSPAIAGPRTTGGARRPAATPPTPGPFLAPILRGAPSARSR